MKKGFTLVELLIVMVVVSILVTLAVPKYKVTMEKGRGLEGLHNAVAISEALNAFYIKDGNTYQTSRQQWAIEAAGATQIKNFTCTVQNYDLANNMVTCTRNTGTYRIFVMNSDGEINQKVCAGEGKYCKALGAVSSGNSGEWSFR